MWLVDRTGAGSGVGRVVGSWAAGAGRGSLAVVASRDVRRSVRRAAQQRSRYERACVCGRTCGARAGCRRATERLNGTALISARCYSPASHNFTLLTSITCSPLSYESLKIMHMTLVTSFN